MRELRFDFRFFLSALVLACCLLFVTCSSLSPTAASAAPLDEVVQAVEGVTAPLNATVETIVPPPPAPPPASPPPAPAPPPVVEVPPVKLPVVPVKVPIPDPVKSLGASAGTVTAAVETAQHTVETANGTVTEAAGAVSSTREAATRTVEQTAANAAGAVEQTTSAGTTSATAKPATERPGTHATAVTLEADAGQTDGLPATPDLPPAASDLPDLGANVPARLLDPFIHVWPAIALTVERSLGHFFRHWARSVLTLVEADGTDSLRGDAGPLAASTPASVSSGQPAFSWIPSPSRGPLHWAASESALLVLGLFIVLATAALTILGLARREVGLPMFRRGNRFPWRH